MKSVLIPTDFSPESRYTLEYVLDFLQHSTESSRVLLVNTYLVHMSTDPMQLVQLNDDLKKKSRVLLEQEVSWARTQCINPLVTIECASHMGTLNNVILNMLRKEKIDLVAMGKGNGNHVEQVATFLKQQSCPLLITYKPQIADALQA